MAKKVSITSKTVLQLRRSLGLNQSQFWNGMATQSGGSRYESGRAIPKPVKQLIYARHYMTPALTSGQLAALAAVR